MGGSDTHDEFAAVIVDILLQRGLKQMSGVDEISLFRQRTNLIIHDGIADVLDQTAQFIRVLDIFEKPLGDPLRRQWSEFFECLSELPKGSPVRLWPRLRTL